MKIIVHLAVLFFFTAVVQGVQARQISKTESPSQKYEYKETRELVQLVMDGAELLRRDGEKAFTEFRRPGSRWRQDEMYIFVLDLKGKMLVHPDASMEGKNEIDLKDINGKPIIRGLINAATTAGDKPEGWYHYQWPVPGGLLPRWKSSYVRLVTTPSGARYVIGSGMYNDRMEKAFVVDTVKDAVLQVEQHGTAAFPVFHDPTSSFIAKDAYIFVIDLNGVELVNPGFPGLEGRSILDLTDTNGKQVMREMLNVGQTQGSGWVDYMWPKPGESVSTQKSAYVSKAKLGDSWVVVGCGVYLADAPKATPTTKKMTPRELMTLVREAAVVFEQRGEKAFPEFRQKGSKWFRDSTYFFVWTLDGTRFFHAANPENEGVSMRDFKDVLGRPMGKMILDAAATPSGEGWIHYMYPEPGDIFPAWKSTFVKRVTSPSGTPYIIGCGIYYMQMDRTFIEDIVNRAADLVAQRGKQAFSQLRDKTGPFFFMDTYVFVNSADGVELVNPGHPSMEGKNMMDLKDVNGKLLVRDYIDAAMKNGGAWVDYHWYRPGNNIPALKHAYVRKVEHGGETYIVGSGFYEAEVPLASRNAR
jgi:signal transduction histidine kinase